MKQTQVTGISTTDDLRAFLANAMEQVESGAMDTDKARTLVKLAGQINESFYSEVKIARVLHEIGLLKKDQSFGALMIKGSS